jgi:hypothetical protein
MPRLAAIKAPPERVGVEFVTGGVKLKKAAK